jgi:hypothetical protein
VPLWANTINKNVRNIIMINPFKSLLKQIQTKFNALELKKQIQKQLPDVKIAVDPEEEGMQIIKVEDFKPDDKPRTVISPLGITTQTYEGIVELNR